jgi:hypothetical protein
MAKRIQRKRTKGWKMPPNTVYVGRPTKWGNPVEITETQPRDKCVEAFRRFLFGMWGYGDGLRVAKEAKSELRGKDLACWCPLGQPCHADVLLEIANADEGPTA